jgi:L-fuculose-phosphate aldolase
MEIPESVKPHIGTNDAVLLANHGALTLGKSLEKAYFLMETLEHTAKIVTYAENLGNVNLLPQEQVDKLMQTFNMPPGSQTCQSCEIDPSGSSNNTNQEDIELIVKKVIDRLK